VLAMQKTMRQKMLLNRLVTGDGRAMAAHGWARGQAFVRVVCVSL